MRILTINTGMINKTYQKNNQTMPMAQARNENLASNNHDSVSFGNMSLVSGFLHHVGEAPAKSVKTAIKAVKGACTPVSEQALTGIVESGTKLMATAREAEEVALRSINERWDKFLEEFTEKDPYSFRDFKKFWLSIKEPDTKASIMQLLKSKRTVFSFDTLANEEVSAFDTWYGFKWFSEKSSKDLVTAAKLDKLQTSVGEHRFFCGEICQLVDSHINESRMLELAAFEVNGRPALNTEQIIKKASIANEADYQQEVKKLSDEVKKLSSKVVMLENADDLFKRERSLLTTTGIFNEYVVVRQDFLDQHREWVSKSMNRAIGYDYKWDDRHILMYLNAERSDKNGMLEKLLRVYKDTSMYEIGAKFDDLGYYYRTSDIEAMFVICKKPSDVVKRTMRLMQMKHPNNPEQSFFSSVKDAYLFASNDKAYYNLPKIVELLKDGKISLSDYNSTQGIVKLLREGKSHLIGKGHNGQLGMKELFALAQKDDKQREAILHSSNRNSVIFDLADAVKQASDGELHSKCLRLLLSGLLPNYCNGLTDVKEVSKAVIEKFNSSSREEKERIVKMLKRQDYEVFFEIIPGARAKAERIFDDAMQGVSSRMIYGQPYSEREFDSAFARTYEKIFPRPIYDYD